MNRLPIHRFECPWTRQGSALKQRHLLVDGSQHIAAFRPLRILGFGDDGPYPHQVRQRSCGIPGQLCCRFQGRMFEIVKGKMEMPMHRAKYAALFRRNCPPLVRGCLNPLIHRAKPARASEEHGPIAAREWQRHRNTLRCCMCQGCQPQFDPF